MNARRMRPTASARVAFALLHLLGAVLLSPSPAVHAVGASDGAADADAQNENAAFQKLLESYAVDTAATMRQKSNEFRELQSKFEFKMQSIHKVRGMIKHEMGALQEKFRKELQDELYDEMDHVGSKAAELMRRTERVLSKVGGYNRKVLEEGLGSAKTVGLEQRLNVVLEEEMVRRDRYDASIASMIQAGASVSEEDMMEDDDDSVAEESANLLTNTSESAPSPYISLVELEELLSAQNVIQPSEIRLQHSLSELASERMQQHIAKDDEMWKSRMMDIPQRYQIQYNAMETEMNQRTAQLETNQCLAIPQAVEMVGKALEEHYYDGTNLVDHANYENGGSVVYELTSSSYIPPPRTNDMVGGDGKRAVYEHEKQRMFDEQMEALYRQQRAVLKQGTDGGNSMMDQVADFADEMNAWEWYSSFRFGSLRQFLPDDWERALDYMSDRAGKGLWSDYTPRGAIDELVPDYIYHTLGVTNDANFGKAFGRTVSPEVAISAGYSKSGNAASGWVAKPMGQCYPLSMRPEDDPALAILSRQTHMEGGMEVMDEDADSSLLVGPKYTVRLPYPVHIDAVTLEHRSFPLSRGSLEGGWKGGESAPRWVRVIGFPPCPKNEFDDEDEEEDACGLRGFDITRPVNLGSFEYNRITVTGREDDYGGSDDEEDGEVKSFPGGRRRSIQTFAVKGGKWKPTTLVADPDAPSEGSMDNEDDISEAAQWHQEEEAEVGGEMPGPGQCAPPKDEDSLPSCGDDTASSSSSSTSSFGKDERQLVEAVSFIVEENWGSHDFTCLYRVRVHGDIVSEQSHGKQM